MKPVGTTLRLGLIGSKIIASRPPALNVLCGPSIGRNVGHDMLIATELRLSFPAVPAHCPLAGFAGVNVTDPHKDEAAARAMPDDLAGIDGIANCTPLGMAGRPGSPLPHGVKGSPIWPSTRSTPPRTRRFVPRPIPSAVTSFTFSRASVPSRYSPAESSPPPTVRSVLYHHP